jgi:tripartite-type tricarboxylate transporter receptor subunit TctC
LPDFETTAWFAMVAPAGTPRAIVARLSAAAATALHDPDVAARLSDLGATTVASTPEALGARIASELARWGAVIKAANITID